MRAQDVLLMPSDKRSKLRLSYSIRTYKKQHRTTLSREDMLRYLRERGIRSWRVLAKKRMPSDPNRYDYQKEFGSWSEAVLKAFGQEVTFELNGNYVLKTVWELGLWTSTKYVAAHKLDPAVVPDCHAVYKEWGSFKRLYECARRFHLKTILLEYLKLGRKLGHRPTIGEAREANLRIDEAIHMCGGKRDMDEIVDGLERQYERTT